MKRIRWTGTWASLSRIMARARGQVVSHAGGELGLWTSEGIKTAQIGDWIVFKEA